MPFLFAVANIFQVYVSIWQPYAGYQNTLENSPTVKNKTMLRIVLLTCVVKSTS